MSEYLRPPCEREWTNEERDEFYAMSAPEGVEIDTSELRLEAQKRMREIDGVLLRNAADEIDALRTRAEKAEAELAELKTKHGAKYPREGYHP